MSLLRNFECFFKKIINKYIIFSKFTPLGNSYNSIKLHNSIKLQKYNLSMDTNLESDSNGLEMLPSPVKSTSDKKEYRVIKLQNGLIACLISDKAPVSAVDESCDETESESDTDGSYYSGSSDSETESNASSRKNSRSSELKMAAAGLCIGVGSYSDPREVPGMAHFLEHMVFMGSKKFPSENDFDSFIKKGGGSDNASTDAETTCFYFECLEKHLFEGLDKFAQFFISPLMKRSAMTREREAIDSEFQMAIPSDSSRVEQLFCSFAKPCTPVNSFSWGNLKTLKDDISDEKLYEGLHEFRKRHYSAHRMTLAIQARLPIETLQSYVQKCFSSVPSNALPPDDFSNMADGIFDTPAFKRRYYIKPNKDITTVNLTWSLPPLQHKYKSKPASYASFLIGHEGKGSLLSLLRKRMWAITTSVGTGDSGSEDNSLFTRFCISVVLTEEGLKHVDEVIEMVFSYINLLKQVGTEERIYNEIKSVADTSFRFATEETASDTVESLCELMQIYPPEDYIAGSEIIYEYDPEAIKMVIDHLQPSEMNIMIFSKKLPNGLKFNETEPWFGTEYTHIDYPNDLITKWESVPPYPEFELPLPNPYLTTDFTILPETPNHPDYPQKIENGPLYELWYRQDQKFKLPIAYYYFHLVSPKSVESAANSTLTEMLMNLLEFCIAEEVYPATCAYLSHQLTFSDMGISIKVDGYNEKLPVLIDVISKYIATLENHITEKMFDAVKDKQLKSYHNNLLKPKNLARDTRMKLLLSNYWKLTEKQAALKKSTYEDVRNFISEYKNSLFVKALVQGNVSQEVASLTVKTFVETVQFSTFPVQQYPKYQVAQVPLGEKCCRIEGFNNTDSNSLVVNYYQSAPFSIRISVIIELIMMIIEEPLFDILRTKEQLGYDVDCSSRDTYGILGFTIVVHTQADKHTTEYVDSRIEEFLKNTEKLLMEMSEEDLTEIKEDLIKTKQCADVHLKEEVSRIWHEIVDDDYVFDRIKQEIQMIEDIKAKEILSWWRQHNKFGSREQFRKLSVQVVGHKKKGAEDVDSKIIETKVAEDESKKKSSAKRKNRREEKNSQSGASEQEVGYDVNDLDEDVKPVPTKRKMSYKPQRVAAVTGRKTKRKSGSLFRRRNKEKLDEDPNYFIHDLEDFRKSLFIYPVMQSRK